MRKNRLHIAAILVFLLCTLLLTACVAASGAEDMEGAQEALQQEQVPALESEELQQEQLKKNLNLTLY